MSIQNISSRLNNLKLRQIPESERKAFFSKLAEINVNRSKVLTFLLLFGSLILIFTDYLNQRNGLWTVLPGYKSLFFTHTLLLVEMVLLLPLLYFSNKKFPNYTQWRSIFVFLFSYFVTINCALTSICDQMINGEMTVFIIGVLAIAIVNYYTPVTSFLIYFFTSITFILGISMTQSSGIILRSEYINGVLIVIISWVLSIMLYYTKVNDYLNEKTIEGQKNELQLTIDQLEESIIALDESQNMIFTLALALESKDTYTRGHSERVADLAIELARFLQLTESDCITLYRASILHDIGKIGIPDAILNKPGVLTAEEWKIMRSHPERGEAICSKLNFAKELLPIIRSHHERYDGTGYPDGLSGESIPFLARIVSIADTVDAITSNRSYRSSRTMEQALKELRRYAGQQFDSSLVSAFIELYNAKREHNIKAYS